MSEGGMIRPDWEEILSRTRGMVVICSCGRDLFTLEGLREHWQRGHFDFVRKAEDTFARDHSGPLGPNWNHITEITPELNRRVQGERRREPREKIADLERRLARIVEIIEVTKCGKATYLLTADVLEIYDLAKGNPA